MKKIISLILALIMLFTVAMPVVYAAEASNEATPIIYLRGNGEAIHFENGAGAKVPAEIDEALGEAGFDKDAIIKEVVNILIPFITKGLPKNEWDECRKAIYYAIAPLFEASIMDGDGNPRFDTTLSLASQQSNANPNIDPKDSYSAGELTFHYDWRCDPYENADKLDKFIDIVLAKTGKKQVSFASRCLGGTVLNAYLERYGYLGKVKNALYGDTLGGGCTILSKLFSGKLDIDGKNTQRYLGQIDFCGENGFGIGFDLPALINEIATTTMDLFTQVNVSDSLGDEFENVYNDLLIMMYPALLHATGYATTPNYWACVREEDFDEAMLLMFGEEGSEARQHYAGLIEKITYYRKHVTSRGNQFFEDMKAYAHIGSVVKYGYLNVSLLEDNDIQSDALASLDHASFGTTSAKIGETLSVDYIASRVAEGKGKYISADKVVDTSTSVIKDTVWVFKNAHHDFYNMIFAVADVFCNGTDVTVESSGIARFNMYDQKSQTWTAMTDENCDEHFAFMDMAEEEPSVMSRLIAGFRFIIMLFKLISMAFKGEISFGDIGGILG